MTLLRGAGVRPHRSTEFAPVTRSSGGAQSCPARPRRQRCEPSPDEPPGGPARGDRPRSSINMGRTRLGALPAGRIASMNGSDGLLGALRELRSHLDLALFPLAAGDVDGDRRALRELTGQLDDYLIPRLSAIDAPLLAVVGGSTGAGKSTLVNSLVGADVSEPGVLRPTTLAPTLVVNPADQAWFTAQHVLPGLPRVTGEGRGEPGTLRVVTVPLSCPVSPSSTPRTSTRSSPPTANWPPSCWPPPTSGCSPPPRPVTRTRCRGASCASPGSGARPWPSSCRGFRRRRWAW